MAFVNKELVFPVLPEETVSFKFSTTIIENQAGVEYLTPAWTEYRCSVAIDPFVVDDVEKETLLAFYNDVVGSLNSFLYKNQVEYQAHVNSSYHVDSGVYVGSYGYLALRLGSNYQMIKVYHLGVGSSQEVKGYKTIKYPDRDTIVIQDIFNNTTINDFTIGDGGVITINEAVAENAVLRFDCEYYHEMRFVEPIGFETLSYKEYQVNNITLVEAVTTDYPIYSIEDFQNINLVFELPFVPDTSITSEFQVKSDRLSNEKDNRKQRSKNTYHKINLVQNTITEKEKEFVLSWFFISKGRLLRFIYDDYLVRFNADTLAISTLVTGNNSHKYYSYQDIQLLSKSPLLPEYSILLAELPTEYTSNSRINVTGIISLLGDTILELVGTELTVYFGFAKNNPIQTTVLDNTGIFNLVYTTADGLTYPQSQIISFAIANEQLLSIPIAVVEPIIVTTDYSISLPTFMFIGGVDYRITGTAKPREIIVIDTTNLAGANSGVSIRADRDGGWVSPLFDIGSDVDINRPATAYLFRNGKLVADNESSVRDLGFDPQVNLNRDVVGLPTGFNNIRTVSPNSDITILVDSGGVVIDSLAVTSDNQGSFSVSELIIPTDYAGQIVNFTFTRLRDGVRKIVSIVAAQFNTISRIELDSGIKYTGDNGGDFTSIGVIVNISKGYSYTVSVYNSGSLVNSVGGLGTGDDSSFSLTLPVQNITADYDFTLTAQSHQYSVVSKIINQGFSADLVNNGIIYRGSPITFTGYAAKGSVVSITVFDRTYTTQTSTNESWSTSIVTPNTWLFDRVDAIISADNVDNYIQTIGFDVVEIVFTLNPLTTLHISGEPLALSGLGKPDETVNVSVTGFGAKLESSIIVNKQGVWQTTLVTPRQNAGIFTVTATSNGYNTLTHSGTHEPKIEIDPKTLSLKQGSLSKDIRIDAPRNRALNLTVNDPSILTNFQNSLNSGDTGEVILTTNDIPLLFPTNFSTPIVVTTANLTQTETTSVIVLPRVPITIEVDSDDLPIPKLLTVLFTNGSYRIKGNSPSNNVLNISSIGSTKDITIDRASNDTYQSTLTTARTPGTAEITVATVAQPASSKVLTISPPIHVDAPKNLNTSDSYNASITTDPEQLIEIKLVGTIDGELDRITKTIDNTGVYNYQYTPNGLSSQTLQLLVVTDYLSYPIQSTKLTNNNLGGSGALSNLEGLDLIANFTLIERFRDAYVNTHGDTSLQLTTSSFVSYQKEASTADSTTKFSSIWYMVGATTAFSLSCSRIIPFNTFDGFTIVFDYVKKPGVDQDNFYSYRGSNTTFNFSYSIRSRRFTAFLNVYGVKYEFYSISGFSFIDNQAYTFTITFNYSDRSSDDKASVSIYINGDLYDKHTYNTTAILDRGTFSFRSRGGGFGNIQLWKRALSESEVKGLFNNNVRREYSTLPISFLAKYSALLLTAKGDTTFGYFDNFINAPTSPLSNEPASELIPQNKITPNVIGSGKDRRFIFDGASQHLTYPSTNDIYTESFWVVKRDDPNRQEVLFEHHSLNVGGSAAKYAKVEFLNSTTIRVRYRTNVTNYFDFKIPAIVMGNWMEIYVSHYTQANTFLVVNGVEYANIAIGALPEVTGYGRPCNIGTDSIRSSYFKGSIKFGEFIWNRGYRPPGWFAETNAYVTSSDSIHAARAARYFYTRGFYRSLATLDPNHYRLGLPYTV